MELGYSDLSGVESLDGLRESLRQDGKRRGARRLLNGGIATAAAVVVFALIGLLRQARPP